jgi:hypothetical protein
MNDLIAEARTQHGDVVDARADVGEQVGDFDSAFAILAK